jgi:malate synthase
MDRALTIGGVSVHGAMAPGYETILTPAALEFIAALDRRFAPTRRKLLEAREERQARLDRGELPGFLAETETIRRGNWQVAPAPPDLVDRRVEITGPVDRKMVINALNSGANVFMADFEDSLTPTWANVIGGQINLKDAVDGTISHSDSETGKTYTLAEHPAVLVVRPRGWHLDEAHVRIGGEAVSGAIFDFGLYLFHNAGRLADKGSGPYYYLPKLESHLEAKLWADIFIAAEEMLGLPHGTIRATVLIETVLAAFEMEEILYHLRDHVCGLNCGRWDYMFSFIKKFRNRPDFVLPDRAQVTMTAPFMRAYTLNLIRICHHRGAHAMGGMAAYIPVKADPAANEAALAAVRADKLREVTDGHDGTWVAHPGLVPLAKAVFDEHMPQPNQLHRYRDDVDITAHDLLTPAVGEVTEAGLRNNLRVGIQYIASWLGGQGCVPLYNLMEDAATAEICRSQVWQWLRHHTHLDDGRLITESLVHELIADEVGRLNVAAGEGDAAAHLDRAVALFLTVAMPPEFVEFLTLPAYAEVATPSA